MKRILTYVSSLLFIASIFLTSCDVTSDLEELRIEKLPSQENTGGDGGGTGGNNEPPPGD